MNHSLPSAYARMLALELGLDDEGIQQLLAGTGLQKKDLFSLASLIPLPELHQIICNGLALSGNPVLGLQIGIHMPLSAHGAVGAAIGAAPTTLDALEVLVRFGSIRVPFIAARTVTQGDTLGVMLECDLPMDTVGRFLMEVMVASLLVLAGMPQGRLRQRVIIHFAYPEPDCADRYRELLGGELHFGQTSTRIDFGLDDVQAANPFADPEVYQQALDLCERLRLRQGQQESWRDRVTGLLQQHPGHLWPIQDIAGALHVSVRSLTRHLAAEGKAYQQLLDEELCRQALLHLAIPGQTVASVATVLGYQDVSSFRRAFRRWQGCPPQDWRLSGADRAKLA